MKLENISYALRVVSEVARTGERLFDSFAASRRARVLPILLGIGVGVAIGAAISNQDVRNRVKAWVNDRNAVRVETKPQPAPAREDGVARPS